MLCKLALRNVRRSLGDYSVYFLTLALGVCLFYAFNALEGQSVMVYLGKTQHHMVASILAVMNIFSAFVSVVLAGLMLYANTFMMKRRKKELATYFLLGLPGGQVARLLWLETLLIGLLALGVGLGLGVFFSHGLSLLTAGMFQINVDILNLSFSSGGTVRTVAYFSLLFLVVMVFNTLTVSRCRLIDLLQAGRRNEELRERPLWVSVLLFLVGVALLGIAYAMLLVRGLLAVDGLFLLMLALGVAGTLLFFRSLSGFLLRVVRSHKGIYYKGLNMFVLRQFNARIHTTYLSMTMVCLMLLLAIGITASSAGLNSTLNQLSQEPMDLSITNFDADTAPADLPQLLGDAGFDPEVEFSAYRQVTIYFPTQELGERLNVNGVIGLADYNALMALQGGRALVPEELPFCGEERLVTGGLRLAYGVVPDAEAQALPIRRQVLAANYAGNPEEIEGRLNEVMPQALDGVGYIVDSRLLTYQDMMGSKVLVIYLGLYLGIVFLLAAAAVLALQQLSQAADNTRRYTVLARLGVERSMARRSVFTQVALAFFLPLSLALVHVAVGMQAANAVIAQVGKVDAWGSTLASATLLAGVYGAYFLATCWGSRRIALER